MALLRIFIEEFMAQGGHAISWDTMLTHYRLSWCMLAIDVAGNPEIIWPMVDWKDIRDVTDARLWNMNDVGRGMLACIRNLAHLWKRLDMPTFFAEWRKANPAAVKGKKKPPK